MSNKMTFGKYEDRTFEWLFFKKPSYAEWIYENGIHRQENRFEEEERHHFSELYRRATHLGGVCCQCKERPVTRMGLTTSAKTYAVLAVGFFCEECEHQGGATTGYYAPSFIVEAYTLSAHDQKMILSEIKRHYIGEGNLTQSKMEEFFHNDANFSECTLGFFSTTAS